MPPLIIRNDELIKTDDYKSGLARREFLYRTAVVFAAGAAIPKAFAEDKVAKAAGEMPLIISTWGFG